MTPEFLTWSNWAGNQICHPKQLARPGSVEELSQLLGVVSARSGQIRVAGSGHSFTPLVSTNDTVVDLRGLPANVSVDPGSEIARVSGQLPLADLGRLLWDSGFAVANQGDVDVQTVAGAIATGTKGSGPAHGTMSSRVVAMTVLNADGEQIRIDASNEPWLRAAQVSLGLLGPVLDIELSVVPRYLLRESNTVMSVDDLLSSWDDLKENFHHFSFWWMPTNASSSIYGLPAVPADHAYVKMLRAEAATGDEELVGEDGARSGPAHLVYPDTGIGDPFYELEYVVPASQDVDAFFGVRDLMRRVHPEETTPVQVRWQAADEAVLSPQYQRDAVSISVSGMHGTDYLPFLRAMDDHLSPRAARPHWGKIHFLTRERVDELYPEVDVFRAVRQEIDPNGTFLNDHLRALFV